MATNSIGDGSANAAPGTPQHADLLNGYAIRPSWQVAGVDYAVGPQFSPTKDPASISMAGVSVNGRTINVTGDNVTLDGYDFSRGGGWQVEVDGANDTISNSNFVLGTNDGNWLIKGGSSSSNLTVKNCTLDASSQMNETGLVGFAGSGLTLENNWFKNFPQHVLEMMQGDNTSSSLVYKYNLIENGANQHGSHLNYLQFGSGKITNADVEFNTSYQPSEISGGEAYQIYNNNTPGSIQSFTLANNTMIAKATDPGLNDHPVSYFLHVGGTTTDPKGVVRDNYFDQTGAYGAVYPNPNERTAASFSGNYDMSTGKLVEIAGAVQTPSSNPPLAGGGTPDPVDPPPVTAGGGTPDPVDPPPVTGGSGHSRSGNTSAGDWWQRWHSRSGNTSAGDWWQRWHPRSGNASAGNWRRRRRRGFPGKGHHHFINWGGGSGRYDHINGQS